MDLMERILSGLDDQTHWDDDDLRRGAANLCHLGLAEQLRPFIADRGKNRVVRRAALKIATSCST